MNISFSRPLSVLALTCSLAITSAFADSSKERVIHISVRPEAAAVKSARVAAKAFGAFKAIDAAKGLFSIQVANGKSIQAAVDRLNSAPGVLSAWSEGYKPATAPFNSIKGLTDLIEGIEEKAGVDSKEQGKEGGGEEKEAGTDYLNSLLYRNKLRAYPYDKIDWSAYERSVEHIGRMTPAHIGTPTNYGNTSVVAHGFTPKSSSNKWVFVGPTNLDTPYQVYYGVRPSTGRVNALAYDPIDSKVIYMAGAMGGIWKTPDSGLTWQALGDAWPVMNASSISIDPSNTKNIYVGTGDFHGFDGYDNGIMKTTDGGVTWTSVGRGVFGDVAVSKVVVDPESPSTILASTGRGVNFNGAVWRSTNGGTSWTKVIATQAPYSDLTYSAKDGTGKRIYYAAAGGAGQSVYKSTDRGVTWTKLTPSLAAGNSISVLAIAASKLNATNVYLLSPDDQKIFKSTDAGGTWTDTTGNLDTGGGYDWSQGWYDYHITTGGSGTDSVFVGLIDVAMSNDAGGTWHSIGGPTFTGGATTHNDQHCVAVNPTNPNEIVIGNDGGVYKAAISGTTATITGLSKNLGITQFYNVVWHPTDPTRILGGSQDNASPVSTGDLSLWGNVGGGDGGYCAINPFNPAVQYCTIYGFDIIKTTNNWTSSTNISPNIGGDFSPFVTPIFQDPTNGNFLYGCTNYLWRYDLAANSWTPRLGGQKLSSNSLIHTAAVAPSSGQTIYTGSEDGEVWYSANGGSTWKKISTGLPNRSIMSISVDKTTPTDIMVALGGTGSAHLYRCANVGGGTPVWASVSGSGIGTLPDVPCNVIERDPTSPTKVWYAATDIGVFSTTNAGVTWQNATTPLGLPNVQVTALNANKVTGYLNAGTFGRGVWRIRLGQETQLAPNRYTIVFGTFKSGNVQSLATVDGNFLSVNSASAGAQGLLAGVDSEFQSGKAPANIVGLDVTVTASCTAATTEQVYMKNVLTSQYDFIKAFPVNSTANTNTLTLTQLSNYVSATGQVNVLVRTVQPARMNGTVYTFNLDKVGLTVRAN